MEEIREKLKVFDYEGFKFNADRHRYTLDGTYLPSVTGVVSKFKPPFDKDGISKRVAKRDGLTQSEVLDDWARKAKTATDLGTEVHNLIEAYWNGTPNPIAHTDTVYSDEAKKRFAAFLAFRQAKLPNLFPLAAELQVFSRKLKVAGTIDLLAFNRRDGRVYIFDWKTNKEFKTDLDKAWDQLKTPFEDLASNHLNDYSIQLSLYQVLLKEEADINVKGAVLLHLPPGGANPVMHHCKDLTGRLRKELTPRKGPEF